MMKKLTHETWGMIDTISLQGPSAHTLQLNDEKMRITLRDEPEILEDVRVLVKAYVTGVIAVRGLAKQLREGDGDGDGKGWWKEETEDVMKGETMNAIRIKVWNKETKKMSDVMTLQQLLRSEHDNGIVEGGMGMEQYGVDSEEHHYGHLTFILCPKRDGHEK